MGRNRNVAAPESERRHCLELGDMEKRSVERSLIERRARLLETIGDTSRPTAARRFGLREASLILPILRRLRSLGAKAD